jgi:hypothetical protein
MSRRVDPVHHLPNAGRRCRADGRIVGMGYAPNRRALGPTPVDREAEVARRCGIPTAAGSGAWGRIRAICPGQRCQNQRAGGCGRWTSQYGIGGRRWSLKRVGCEPDAVGSPAGCGSMRRGRARSPRIRRRSGSGWPPRVVQSSKVAMPIAFGTWYVGWSKPPSEPPASTGLF